MKEEGITDKNIFVFKPNIILDRNRTHKVKRFVLTSLLKVLSVLHIVILLGSLFHRVAAEHLLPYVIPNVDGMVKRDFGLRCQRSC